jgi:hypothetical protein
LYYLCKENYNRGSNNTMYICPYLVIYFYLFIYVKFALLWTKLVSFEPKAKNTFPYFRTQRSMPLHNMYDEDIHATDTSMPIQVPISGPITSGPITRARARQLNHQVITLLSACPSYLDHGNPCTLVLLRNQGEDRKGKGFEHAGFGLQKNTNL